MPLPAEFIRTDTLNLFLVLNRRVDLMLAVESGYEIAWDLVTQDEMFAASVASFHGGSNEALATILNKIIRPVR
jgi:hypothetical protein